MYISQQNIFRFNLFPFWCNDHMNSNIDSTSYYTLRLHLFLWWKNYNGSNEFWPFVQSLHDVKFACLFSVFCTPLYRLLLYAFTCTSLSHRQMALLSTAHCEWRLNSEFLNMAASTHTKQSTRLGLVHSKSYCNKNHVWNIPVWHAFRWKFQARINAPC